jgi:uncharacterized protein
MVEQNTATADGARRHARSMAGTRVECMPTVPSTGGSPPAEVAQDDLLWDETIGEGDYTAKRLNRGARLRLMDLGGDGCASMLLFNAERPIERLNIADTAKVQWNGYVSEGSLLLSDMGKVLMSVLEDSSGGHDLFCGCSNEESNRRKYGDGSNWGPYPNARDRFSLGVAKFGLGRKDIHPCINWFKPVLIEHDGATRWPGTPMVTGQQVTLRAEMNVIVVIANCPHVLDPRRTYGATPIRVVAWRGDVTPDNDPIRNKTPEGLRAFLNVEEEFRR